MDSGYYVAMSGWLARTQALDTAAVNLANAQTTGYRSERDYFRSALLGPDAGKSQVGTAINQYGVLGGDRLSLAQGSLQRTGNSLDLAIEGDGFFAIKSGHGIRYTRDGSFHRSQSGILVTSSNEPVLSSDLQQIPVPPGEVAVGTDGALSVGGGVVSSVGVFTFASGAQLQAEGANRYVAPENARAVQSRSAVLHQGALESANQDIVQGTLDLILMQRQAEMLQKAVSIFHTEFNKTATEDLPRI